MIPATAGYIKFEITIFDGDIRPATAVNRQANPITHHFFSLQQWHLLYGFC